MSDEQSEPCVMDSTGECITHAPGTAGEQAQHARIVNAARKTVHKAGRVIADIGMMFTFAAAAVDAKNKARAAKGLRPLRNSEDQCERILARAAQALMAASDELEALERQTDAAESAPSAASAN